MNNNNNLAKNYRDADSFVESAEPPIRPKVMRRPANFSAARVSLPPPVAKESLPAPMTDSDEDPLPLPPSPSLPDTEKHWQDDIRFGAVLVSVVLLINLGLTVWLPQIRNAQPASRNTAARLDTGSEITLKDDASRMVTLYTKPAPADAASEGQNGLGRLPRTLTIPALPETQFFEKTPPAREEARAEGDGDQ